MKVYELLNFLKTKPAGANVIFNVKVDNQLLTDLKEQMEYNIWETNSFDITLTEDIIEEEASQIIIETKIV